MIANERHEGLQPGNDVYIEGQSQQRLPSILRFCGSSGPARGAEGLNKSVSAIVEDGPCAYLAVLEDLEIEPELAGITHVVHGAIVKDGSRYSTLRDLVDISR